VKDAAEFRKRADECRQLAKTSRTPEDQALWLRLARDWLSLAETADENERTRAGQDSKKSN
jgi:hypothetical protein